MLFGGIVNCVISAIHVIVGVVAGAGVVVVVVGSYGYGGGGDCSSNVTSALVR